MARTQGSSARAQRLTALVATLLVAAATAFAFARVFQDHASTYRILAAGLASASIAAVLERRNLVLATATSALALVWVIAILVFPETLWHGLPSLDTLRAIAEGALVVGAQSRTQVAPTPPTAPLLLACVTGIWAAVFSTHALAFRASSPMLSLAPPLALIAFADSVLEDMVRPLYGVIFLTAALTVLFADGLRRVQSWGPVWSGSGKAARLLPSAGRGARRVGAGAVGLALIAPLLIPGFGSQALLDLSTRSDRVAIDPFVSVRASLIADAPRDLFTVRSPAATYWRMLSLPNFDGSGFSPDDSFDTQDVSGSASLADASAADPTVLADSDTLMQTFTAVDDLGLLWLPVAYPPAEVDVDRDVAWTPETGTASLEDPLDTGQSYTAVSYLVQPTADDLRLETFPTAAQNQRYTTLPSDSPRAIATIAHSWTDGEATVYDKIIAVQEHLLSSDYRYSLDVPARDSSFSLLDFLTVTKEGFCQQFSSAMAVLLRSLGIPARVAVGFTAGTYDRATDLYTVSTDDAHAWVEVEFPTYGWLAFEPTPGRTNPVAIYSNPDERSTQCSSRRGCVNPGDPSNPGLSAGGGRPLRPQQEVPERRTSGDLAPLAPVVTAEPATLWTARHLVWAAAAAAALVFVAIPTLRAWRRRRRLRRARHDPRALILATYDVFTERAGELGFVRSAGETLEEYRARVGSTGRLRGGSLDRLTVVASDAAYSPRQPGNDDARVAEVGASEALRELRKAAGLAQRVVGAYRRV